MSKRIFVVGRIVNEEFREGTRRAEAQIVVDRYGEPTKVRAVQVFPVKLNASGAALDSVFEDLRFFLKSAGLA